MNRFLLSACVVVALVAPNAEARSPEAPRTSPDGPRTKKSVIETRSLNTNTDPGNGSINNIPFVPRGEGNVVNFDLFGNWVVVIVREYYREVPGVYYQLPSYLPGYRVIVPGKAWYRGKHVHHRRGPVRVRRR